MSRPTDEEFRAAVRRRRPAPRVDVVQIDREAAEALLRLVETFPVLVDGHAHNALKEALK